MCPEFPAASELGTLEWMVEMQLAKSIIERVTAQAILPMITLGISGAIAVAVVELLSDFRVSLRNQ